MAVTKSIPAAFSSSSRLRRSCWDVHDFPPSSVRSTAPSPPTAQPRVEVAKCIALRFLLRFSRQYQGDQVLPSSAVRSGLASSTAHPPSFLKCRLATFWRELIWFHVLPPSIVLNTP